MIRLGGPVSAQSNDPRQIARAHKKLGYRAAYCPPVGLDDKTRIRDIRDAFAAEDVTLAEVGAWCNMVAAEPALRAQNYKHVCERLALADEVGALCCVDYLGSIVPGTQFAPHADNFSAKGFDLCVQTVRQVIDEVEPRRAKFCLEMMQWCLPDSSEVYRELIQAVDRPAFGVHVDVVNIVTSPRLYFATGKLIRDCFHVLGEWIVSCHAKDIIAREQLALHLDETPPGTGNLDYRAYLTELARQPRDIPLMLEHLSRQDEYTRAREYIVALAKEMKIQL